MGETNGGDGGGGAAEVVSVELPAPPGWKKKFIPRNGVTHKKNEIIFIAPTGEEFNNRRQLERYLKTHAAGPSVSEFDWGTGEAPRRSVRIGEKAKAVAPPEPTEPKKKQSRKSSDSKVSDMEPEPVSQETYSTDGAMKDADKEATTEGELTGAETKSVEDAGISSKEPEGKTEAAEEPQAEQKAEVNEVPLSKTEAAEEPQAEQKAEVNESPLSKTEGTEENSNKGNVSEQQQDMAENTEQQVTTKKDDEVSNENRIEEEAENKIEAAVNGGSKDEGSNATH